MDLEDYSARERLLWRRVDQAQQHCLAQVHHDVDALQRAGLATPRQILALMARHFEASSIPGCDRGSDGDMLLAQWGTYEVTGQRLYEFNVTRQFTVTAFEDGPMTQLAVTLYYEPKEFASIVADHVWSSDHEHVAAFHDAVISTAGYRAVSDTLPSRVEVLMSLV